MKGTGEKAADRALSITVDVDAHLQKVATNTYSSIHHYPVELVRSALSRGADKVEIRSLRDRLEVRDNGAGIDESSLKRLRQLMDFSQPEGVREEAVNALRSPRGIGLLAVFSPAPQAIVIENVSPLHRTRLRFQGGRLETSADPGINGGTRLVIYRKAPHRHREISVVQDFCRAVEQEIILNGRPLEKRSIIADALVSVKLESPGLIEKGEAAVTRRGDICKAWLLEMGIPWFFTTFSSLQGFVFEAVVETDREVSDPLLDELSAAASRLYAWISRRYPHYPAGIRERVEELIFKYRRLMPGSSRFGQFAPFKVIGSDAYLSIDRVKKMAAEGDAFALPRGSDVTRYRVSRENVLELSRRQMDFLINRQHLPIRTLSPAVNGSKGWRRRYILLVEKARALLSKIHISKGKIIPGDRLRREERVFLHLLNRYLSKSAPSQDPLSPGGSTGVGMPAAMIDSRGWFPSFPRRPKGPGSGETPVLHMIRRRHPLVKRAIRAVQKDPDNIEIALPLLGL